jgi:multiple sugar transport system substrate-binding protein
VLVAEFYSRRSFLAGVLTAGMLSTSAGFLVTRRESITLRLATGVDRTGGRELLITMWNQLNPDTQIIPQVINSSTQDQFAKFDQSRADIFNLDAIHIRRFADAGRIVPFDPHNDISLLPPVQRLCQVPGTGRLWAAPFNSDVGMLYRRITDKRAADIEPSLSSVLRESAAGPIRFAGQLDTVGVQTDEAFVCNVLEHALAADDAILDENGVLSYGLGQWRNALEPLAEAVRARRVRATAGEDDTTRAFARQNLTYMRNWPVDFLALDRSERAEPDTAEIRLGRLPVGILGGQSLAISADTEHRAEAERAIHFLTDTPAQRLLATFGFAPTGVDAYIDPTVQASLPHLNIIRYAVESARPRPMHANYALFSRRFADHTRRYLHGNEPLTQRFIQDIREALG